MARLTIGPVRISYAHLYTPRAATTPGQKAKYGASILIPKTAAATLAKVQAAIAETKKAYFDANGSKAAWVNNAQTTLYDGDGFRKGGDSFGPEAKGHWVLSASSLKQPMVVDVQKQPILDENLVYSGCFGLVVINFYAYDSSGNKGVACALDGFMKTADGDPLSGYKVSDSDWDNVAANDLAQLNAMLE